ncbi:TetR/AcrR family transcriptional regulator [Streptomyces sp. NPDC048523]|uniref:TetR/AcrR family transcriptional regulator n=1 Tax=Streptomyces sp. NPDC048523 TaxID=3365567 RepID=UPI003719645A
MRAATELPAEPGTSLTVEVIAKKASLGPATVVRAFGGKEALRGPAEGPVDVLVRALENVAETDADMVGPMAAVRMRLFRTVPAVRGKALQIQLDAQREIARELHAASPDELDRVSTAALAGALTGAVSGALDALMALMDEEGGATDGVTPDAVLLRAQVREATELALRPWREGGR